MAEKWIVTGGCGFIGSNLAAALLEDGVDVVVLDTLVRLGSSENLAWLEERARRPGAGRLVHLRADTRSRTDVDDAFARHADGVTAVAHLAGQVAMTTSIERPRYDFEVNALGAMNVLEAIRAFAPGAVAMFSSTNKVYGDLAPLRHVETATRWTLPDFPRGLDEKVPLDFHSPYGCSKGAADQYSPAVSSDGTMYYTRGGNSCGKNISLIRRASDGTETTLYSFASGVDAGDLVPTGSGKANGASATPSRAGRRRYDGVNCDSVCSG